MKTSSNLFLQKFVENFKNLFEPLNQSPNMIPASNHREPPFGLSVIMVLLFFGVNAILFVYFQWISLQKQANTTTTTTTELEVGGGGGGGGEKSKTEKGHHAVKELSKPFQGTLDCYIHLTTELFRVGLILLMTYICEYLWFFHHSTKTYSRDLFIFVLIIFFGYAYYTIKPIKDLSLLGREQTEEWKGWMQFIFLLYHYFHAEEVYNPVRVMITCYVWMTGFGNFSFFYIKQDFSWLRVVQMLWRLNFSVLLLMWTHQNTWILYYICPMHTFYFMMVYVTMYLFSSLNATKWGIRWKLLIVGIIIYIIWDYNQGLFDIIFSFLGTEKVIGANSGSVWEWYFRTSLDHWSTYLGMIFALNFPLCEQFFTKAKGTPLIVTAVLMGMLTIYWFYFYYPLDKLEYNLSHSYFAIIPLTSYIFFRNITPYIRSGVSMSLHELGKTTLETYLLQHHIWLSSNAKTLWTVMPGNPWINFAVATIIFFVVSKELYRLTMSIRGMILPDDKNIAWRNMLGLGGIWAICYAIAYVVSLFQLSVLEIIIICVGLSGIALFVIGFFFQSNSDQHYHQAFFSRALRNLGILFVFLIVIQLVTRDRTQYTDPNTNEVQKPLVYPFGNSDSCLHAISSGRWLSERCDTVPAGGKNAPISKASSTATAAGASSADTAYCIKHEWKWNPVVSSSLCPIQKVSTKTAQTIFQNKQIVFFGDSITRSSYHAFVHLLDSNYSQLYDYTYKHSSLSYQHPKLNISVHFRWTPYVKNITSEYQQLSKKAATNPIHYVIMGSIFWDALNIHDLNDYSRDLNNLAKALQTAPPIGKASTTATPTNNSNNSAAGATAAINKITDANQQVRVWLMPTDILNERLPTEEKRLYMNQQKVSTYRQKIEQIFNQSNHNNVAIHNIIDARAVSQLRESSSVDGVHFTDEVYAVIAQMIANNYYVHFPKFYASSKAAPVAKPYIPKTTGAMSFPGYGAALLAIAAVMLFTMDSFFGFGYISLVIFGRSFDWDAAYGPYLRKIQAVNNEKDDPLPSSSVGAGGGAGKEGEIEFEAVPLLSNRSSKNNERDSMA